MAHTKYGRSTLRILGLLPTAYEMRQRDEVARSVAGQMASVVSVFGTPDEARARVFLGEQRSDQELLESGLDAALGSMEERAIGGNFANA